jgi:hypothetical protein
MHVIVDRLCYWRGVYSQLPFLFGGIYLSESVPNLAFEVAISQVMFVWQDGSKVVVT